jgi:hypothetical protein
MRCVLMLSWYQCEPACDGDGQSVCPGVGGVLGLLSKGRFVKNVFYEVVHKLLRAERVTVL